MVNQQIEVGVPAGSRERERGRGSGGRILPSESEEKTLSCMWWVCAQQRRERETGEIER